MKTEPELDVVDPLAAGRQALSRGEWEQALAYFEAASERNRSAETIEALAMAAWWLDNALRFRSDAASKYARACSHSPRLNASRPAASGSTTSSSGSVLIAPAREL